jgi:hypothetical protein
MVENVNTGSSMKTCKLVDREWRSRINMVGLFLGVAEVGVDQMDVST